jgi:hypothetical protein
MTDDIENAAGTAPPRAASPLTAADAEVVENLLARLRCAELAKIHHRDPENRRLWRKEGTGELVVAG